MFVRRKGNRKKEGEGGRWLLPVLRAAVALLSSILVLLLGWHHVIRVADYLHNSLFAHSYFSVQEIKVRGGEKVGGSEIVAIAGLSRGMNIWKIDPVMIAQKVGKHPWVKRVSVRREFPRRVVIEVEERVAKGIVVLERPYYVDSEGAVFKEVGEEEKMDLPLLTGLRQADFVSQARSTRQRIQEALRLSDLVGRRSLALSEIHFLHRGGVVLYPMAYPVALHMGWGDWQRKVQGLERVLELWKAKEDRLVALDLSFRGQVVARPRSAGG